MEEPFIQSLNQCSEPLDQLQAHSGYLNESSADVYLKKESTPSKLINHPIADVTVKLEPFAQYDDTDRPITFAGMKPEAGIHFDWQIRKKEDISIKVEAFDHTLTHSSETTYLPAVEAGLKDEPLQQVARDIYLDEQTRIEDVDTSTNIPYPVDMFINRTSRNNEVNNEAISTRTKAGQMRTNTGEKPYKCSSCPYRCSNENVILAHLRTHTGEKPYKCSLCPYRSAQTSDLKIHMRGHTGEKPYTCSYCQHRSARESELKKHIRIHTGEKPYKCSICPYRASDQSAIKSHMRTHIDGTSYKCSLCPYRCTNESILKVHLQTHEKSYHKCSLCPYRCTNESFFNLHVRSHAWGKTIWPISLCGPRHHNKNK